MNAKKVRKIGLSILLVFFVFIGSNAVGILVLNSKDDNWLKQICLCACQDIFNYRLECYQYGKGEKAVSTMVMHQMPMLQYAVKNYEKVEQENIIAQAATGSLWLENQIAKENSKNQGKVDYIPGEAYIEDVPLETGTEQTIQESTIVKKLKENRSVDYLLKNFYTVDSTTKVDKTLFDVKKMLSKDFSIKKDNKPQILIFHTHGASESFCDSREGVEEDSVVGVGSYLTQILENKYGYQVIHDKTKYDNINGKIDRSRAYNYALPSIQETLEKNKSIEVVIDLHRDGVSGKQKRVTTINGKKTAKFMFFNGISRNTIGPIAYLYNPNLEGNLSFSLQLKIKAMEKYPDLTLSNYLKGYRYNLHLKERSLLIELGNQNNTVEEVKNAMEPLADILNEILNEK